ncbi:MAG TPA: DNA primase [Candidatus Babeliales bacterium]|jgi:DNA primase|nr:DNA primase [Candidatus Babeliales bacterium]
MNLFSFIKSRISILDVINEYVTLKKAGGYHKGTCPFHHEKTASFTVSPDKEIFYCFGCHLSGDAISFIAKIENCSQKDAAKLLAEKYSIDLPQNISFELSEKNTENKNHYFSVCKAVALWCHEQLLKSPSAQTYFQRRGFGTESFDYFTLGYFPSGNASINDLLYAMKRQSILPRDLIDAHILAEGRTTLYSSFEERLIFPIKDILGRHCGFGGRTFKEHDTRPKYYNSRENDYFIKGSLLFNLDKAKKSIQETGKIFLVEGYTDCMAMTQQGFPNTVATLGTSCTVEHLKQLARYAEHIYVVYDNDSAGNQAVLRLTELCWQVNLELKVILLPQGEDPASFFYKKGDMQTLIHGAQDIFLFFIDTLGHNFINKPLNQKIQTTRSFISIITAIPDPLKKDILLQKAAKTFDIPFVSLKDELARTNQAPATPAHITLPTANITIPLLEKRIFCAIMNNMQLFAGESRLRLIKYLPSPLRDILAKLKAIKETTTIITFGLFFDTLNEQEKQYVSRLLLEENEIVDTTAFDKLLEQLQKKQWKIIVRDIKIQLTQAKQEGNADKISLILRDLMELQNKLVSTSHPDSL